MGQRPSLAVVPDHAPPGDANEHLKLLAADVADLAVFLLSEDGTVSSWDGAAQRLFGHHPADVVGQHWEMFATSDAVAAGLPARALGEAAGSGRYVDECWQVRRDGSRFWAHVSVSDLGDRGVDRRGFGVVTRDLTAREADRLAVRTTEERVARLLAHSTDAVCVVDAGGLVRYASPAHRGLYGEESTQRLGRPLAERIHPDDRARFSAELGRGRSAGEAVTFECRIIHGDISAHNDLSIRTVELTVSGDPDDPAVGGLVVNGRDVTERIQVAHRLAHQATHDALTGLANRAVLKDRIAQACLRAEAMNTSLALLSIDLDFFRRVNDSLGHAAGDTLLMTVAGRLKQTLRTGDTAARLGEDEFVVLAENVAGEHIAHEIAERIRSTIDRPVVLDGRDVSVGCSVGITVAAGGRPETILQEADTALYWAKARGRNRVEHFDGTMRVRAQAQLDTEATLRHALEDDRIVVHYQPIVSLPDATPLISEALVRMRDDRGALIAPADFIPAAEDSGLILPLGIEVLRQACRQLARWHRDGVGPARMSVNVSACQLRSPTLLADVRGALAAAGIEGPSLVLELTETALIGADRETSATVSALADMGIRIALDDFGTGMSSLAHLRAFPIHAIKIDRTFVAGLGVNRDDTAVVRSLIGLAAGLGLTLVAEGVEEQRQADLLTELGCVRAQGFLFGRPQPAGA